MQNFDSTLIVGGGAMAVNQHIPRLEKLLGSRNIVIFDIDKFRQDQLNFQFKNNDSIEIMSALPTDRQFDLVLITTPPKFHFQYFSNLVKCSDKFLIEKPITINSPEAKELEIIANTEAKLIFVNLIRRTLKSYKLISELADTKRYGELKTVVVNEGGVFGWGAVSKGPFSHDLNGGGVLMDTGPHTLDLLFQIFDDLLVVNCEIDGVAPAVEANCQLTLIGNNAIPVRVNLSRNRHLSNMARFEFEEAVLKVGVMGEIVKVEEKSGIQYQVIAEGANSKTSWSGMVDDFYLNYIVNADNVGVGASESIKIACVIDEAYAKASYVDPGF